MTDRRCEHFWRVRDTYRYTGRGKSGFQMHYKQRRCKRKAMENGFCWQHQEQARLKQIRESVCEQPKEGEGE